MPLFDRYLTRHLASLEHLYDFNSRPPVDYIAVGDSTCLHLIQPQKIPIPIDNLCLSGATTLDTYNVLNRINLNQVRRGIIVAASLYSKSHYRSHFWNRFIAGDFYSDKELFDIYALSALHKMFPASEMNSSEYILTILQHRWFLFEDAFRSASEFPERLLSPLRLHQLYRQMASENRGYIPWWQRFQLSEELFFKPYKEFYSQPFQIDKADLYYLEKILLLAASKKLTVLFLSPILASRSFGIDTSIFESGFESYFMDLERKHPYFKYIKIPPPKGANLYADFNHLNEVGADLVAEQISQKITNINNSSTDHK